MHIGNNRILQLTIEKNVLKSPNKISLGKINYNSQKHKKHQGSITLLWK